MVKVSAVLEREGFYVLGALWVRVFDLSEERPQVFRLFFVRESE